MKLHQLKNTYKRQSRKRVGRGDSSGRGRTCGRGDKGAGARAGHTHRPYFEGGQIPLFRRLPKRGFKNPNRVPYHIINVSGLEEAFDPGTEVDAAALRQAGLIGKGNHQLKILGDGDISKPLTVKANKFSANAKKKIEAAGGSCLLV